mmetsp:Transcript_5946/g.18808  ORF Transcript_5946/g.18808 Transcript_5946/m.18808 type:complete len:328 (-) Transcript_5946:241-1224(-)
MNNLKQPAHLQEVAPTVLAQWYHHEVGLMANRESEHRGRSKRGAHDHGSQRHALRCGHLHGDGRHHGDDRNVGDQVAEGGTDEIDGQEAADGTHWRKQGDQGLSCPNVQANGLDSLPQWEGTDHRQQDRGIHGMVDALLCHRPSGQEEEHEDDQVASQGEAGEPLVHTACHEDADGKGGSSNCTQTAPRVALAAHGGRGGLRDRSDNAKVAGPAVAADLHRIRLQEEDVAFIEDDTFKRGRTCHLHIRHSPGWGVIRLLYRLLSAPAARVLTSPQGPEIRCRQPTPHAEHCRLVLIKQAAGIARHSDEGRRRHKLHLKDLAVVAALA